jgi:hypothetical protein
MKWKLDLLKNLVEGSDRRTDAADSSLAMRSLVTSTIAIAVLFCYYSRLTFSQQGEFLDAMQQRMRRCSSLHACVRQVWKSSDAWDELVDGIQLHVVKAMKLGPGIALNAALK